jgi:transcriptional regulator with XRE-family HTH domain
MPKTIYRREYGTFLRLLREYRLAAGLTQAQCSAGMGRPQSFVSDVERGVRRLDIVQLRDLCEVVQINLVEFVTKFEEGLTHLSRPKVRRATRR